MACEYDNLHWDFREIDGYNADFNLVVSEREAGKTTAIWRKNKLTFDRGATFLLTRQRKVSISDIYLNDCAGVINKFIADPKKRVRFHFAKSQIEKGIVDVYASTYEKGSRPRIFFRCVALSNKMSDMKSLYLPNCVYHVGDEFIVNTAAGEEYLDREGWRYKELINTFIRESYNTPYRFKSYLFGNPYSRANPYFIELGIDISKIKRGKTIVSQNGKAVLQCYEIKQELRDFILKNNPLYQFSDEYTRYAFDGLAVNDAHMIIKPKQPEGFRLLIAIRIEGKILGIYQAPFTEDNLSYWVGSIPANLSANRPLYAMSFRDLQTFNTVLFDSYSKKILQGFKFAMSTRRVAFQNSQFGIWAEEIYTYI